MDRFPTETLGNDKCGETFGNDSFSLCHPERSDPVSIPDKLGKDSSSFGLGMTTSASYPKVVVVQSSIQ